MADIFVSYTSKDRDWAFWIGQELLKLGHAPHVHEWEIKGGGDIFAWMEDHHDEVSHVLCNVIEAYLKGPVLRIRTPGRAMGRNQQAAKLRFAGFCRALQGADLVAVLKRCDLYGLAEEEARARLELFTKPPARPTGPVSFPGTKTEKTSETLPSAPIVFPGKAYAISNVPINVRLHFLGRDEDLAVIERAFKRGQGRVATLAVAYVARHSGQYRATWWIRAETESTMRANLAGLGVRLGWVAPDAPEPAITTDCIRLHRLVREVAAARRKADFAADATPVLIAALAEVDPDHVSNNPAAWSRARRLDAFAMVLVAGDARRPDGAEMAASYLLNQLAVYRPHLRHTRRPAPWRNARWQRVKRHSAPSSRHG